MNKKHYLKPEMRIFELRAVNVFCGSGGDDYTVPGYGEGDHGGEPEKPKYRTQLWN